MVGFGDVMEVISQVIINQQDEEIKLYQELYKTMKKHRWILIEEKLPEKNKWVRLSDGKIEVKGKRINDKEWFGPEITAALEKRLTHWQEIILPI